MRQRVIPLLVPPIRNCRLNGAGCYETKARGMAVLTTPLLNKGTAFPVEERKALGLTGLLPAVIGTSLCASPALRCSRTSNNLRSVSATVAVAVAEAAAAEGLARVELDNIVQQVQDAMWQPEYCRIQAA